VSSIKLVDVDKPTTRFEGRPRTGSEIVALLEDPMYGKNTIWDSSGKEGRRQGFRLWQTSAPEVPTFYSEAVDTHFGPVKCNLVALCSSSRASRRLSKRSDEIKELCHMVYEFDYRCADLIYEVVIPGEPEPPQRGVHGRSALLVFGKTPKDTDLDADNIIRQIYLTPLKKSLSWPWSVNGGTQTIKSKDDALEALRSVAREMDRQLIEDNVSSTERLVDLRGKLRRMGFLGNEVRETIHKIATLHESRISPIAVQLPAKPCSNTENSRWWSYMSHFHADTKYEGKYIAIIDKHVVCAANYRHFLGTMLSEVPSSTPVLTVYFSSKSMEHDIGLR